MPLLSLLEKLEKNESEKEEEALKSTIGQFMELEKKYASNGGGAPLTEIKFPKWFEENNEKTEAIINHEKGRSAAKINNEEENKKEFLEKVYMAMFMNLFELNNKS